MTSLHCVPIHVASMEEFTKRLRADGHEADLIEVWLDSIEDLRLAEIFFIKEELGKPFLCVNKEPEEGGDFMGLPQQRVELLVEAFERGAEYVDVNLKTDLSLLKKLKNAKPKGAQLILSYHNFDQTPPLEELKALVKNAQKDGADIIKIATFIADVSDNVTLLALQKWAGEQHILLIAVGMGDLGHISRVICPLLGSPIYYAPLREGANTAPGQLTKTDLEAIWSHLS